MANRFPLVLDTTDGNKIKELPADDNLNLRESSILDVQNINALGIINAPIITVAGKKLVAQNFADLTDTPGTFAGSENYFVKVNETGSGIEFRPLGDIGNITVETISTSNSILPTVTNTSNIGSNALKFNQVYSTQFRGNLASYDGSVVFDATTGRISYAALQGAPAFLSEFQDDIGFLRQADLDSSIANLFDQGEVFTNDIKGSVFGDDSTILVDGVSGIITGNVLNSQIITDDLNSTSATLTNVTATTVNGPTAGNLEIDAGNSGIINIGYGVNTTEVNIKNAVIDAVNQGTGLGIAQLSASTDLSISAGNRIKIDDATPFRLAHLTAAELLLVVGVEGDLIYNTTTSRLQMYQGGEWLDINGNINTTTGSSGFNNVTIAGNLTVSGTTTTVDTENTTISDNVIVLNEGEEGAGVTAGTSGIEIDRGTEANKTFVWDDSVDKWTLGSETLAAGRFESVGVATSLVDSPEDSGILQIKAGAVDDTGNTIFVNPYGSDTTVQIQGETINLQTGPYNTYDSPYMQFKTEGAFKTYQGAYFDGNLIGDVTGSVFGDDSTILVDSVAGIITGDVENTEVITTTVQGRDSTALNIYRGTGGTVSLGDASSGDVTVGDSGINITSTAGVDINGAATGTVNIGTSATTGNVTIGKADNTTTIDGTFNATLTGNVTGDVTGNVTGDVTGNVTGNIDNETLTLGATDATTIAIGNADSTTTINGTVSLSAVVAGSITADDSMSITTATGDGNTISIGPAGTNRIINLTADDIRFFGPITTTIIAQGSIEGDLKGSVVADDSSMIIDSVNNKVLADVDNNATVSNSIRTPLIRNLEGATDIDVYAEGFLELFGGNANAGLSKVQLDTNGINYIELTTEPNSPANPADVANIAINATTASGNVIIGTTGSTRNQIVTINNATVNGTLIGSAQGNHTGTLTGDVTGSVFSDDSSPMVDALNYAMFSDTLTLTPLNIEPADPVNGMIAVADGTGWDPASNAKNTLVAYLGGAWVTVAAAA